MGDRCSKPNGTASESCVGRGAIFCLSYHLRDNVIPSMIYRWSCCTGHFRGWLVTAEKCLHLVLFQKLVERTGGKQVEINHGNIERNTEGFMMTGSFYSPHWHQQHVLYVRLDNV